MQACGMARRSDTDDLHGWPRVLEACGIGLLLAGCGLSLGAIFGAASVGGLWYGAALTTAGLFTRAAAYGLEAWDIEHRGVEVPKRRPGPDGRVPENDLEAVLVLEQELTEPGRRFAAMIDDERKERGGIGRGG
jgi:4-hydroxybenzoate polyprenyltransferase